MSTHGHTPSTPAAAPIEVRTADGRVTRFSQTFQIGREQDCELRLDDVHVSRKHVEVAFRNGRWRVCDLKSSNGIFINGHRVDSAPVDDTLTITLGIDGPSLTLDVGGKRAARPPAAPAATVQQSTSETKLLANYAERYFGSGSSQERVGGRTLMIRKAFENIQKKQRRRYAAVVAVVSLIALAAGVFAYRKQQQVHRLEQAAQEFFYQMKALDVTIARFEQELAKAGNTEGRARIRSLLAQRRGIEGTYDEYIAALNVYDRRLSEEDRLILRVTRLFGECEVSAPEEYLDLVKSYIRKWQSSDRFVRAVTLAQHMQYPKTIADEFLLQNLPPHFFYLALQESNFDEFTSGPPTKWGYAKGMWQFIPETGARYGLTIGPLVKVPKPDPSDDRHNWKKATKAAAHYIRDIYATDAQASGLLVMASYNWGEGRVINLLRSMPESPQERNFWKVLEKHRNRIPSQTYEYVFNIVAAAVIGENPRLFKIPMDNPLAFVERQQ